MAASTDVWLVDKMAVSMADLWDACLAAMTAATKAAQKAVRTVESSAVEMVYSLAD
jgi:hypothetical protein